VPRGGVGAEALEPGDVGFEGIFDVGGPPLGRLGFVEFVEQVAGEFEELRFVERLWEGFGDALASLFGVHELNQADWTELTDRHTFATPLQSG